MMFSRWVPAAGYNRQHQQDSAGDVRLLGGAIADVGQSRRQRPDSIQRLNLQTLLTVLKRRVQEDSHPDDLVSLSCEQAIGNDCSLTGYGPS